MKLKKSIYRIFSELFRSGKFFKNGNGKPISYTRRWFRGISFHCGNQGLHVGKVNKQLHFLTGKNTQFSAVLTQVFMANKYTDKVYRFGVYFRYD